MTKKKAKIVLKIFDSATSRAKSTHTCNACMIYKREIAKGNSEALQFYRDHINEVVRKNNGATIVIDGDLKQKLTALPSAAVQKL